MKLNDSSSLSHHSIVGWTLLLLLAFSGSGLAADCIPAPSGLTAWWRGGNNALDSIGTSHGTLHGTVTAGTGRVGQAWQFDGVEDYVEFPDEVGNFRTDDFSIECWFKSSTAGIGHLVTKRGGSCDFGNFIELDFAPNGYLWFHIGESSVTSYAYVYSAQPLNDGVFHHVVVTRSGTDLDLFIDGSLAGSTTTPGVLDINNDSPLRVGKSPCGGYNGLVDELSLYSRALNSAEVAALFAAGSEGKCVCPSVSTSGLVSWWRGEDNALDSVGTHHGTLQNGATYAAGRVGTTLSFDGVDDFFNVPDSTDWDFGSSDLTIDFWTKLNQVKDSMFIHQQSGAATGGFEFDYQLGTPGSLVFASSVDHALIIRPWSPMTDTWYHLAVVRSQNVCRLYVNGVQLGAEQADATPMINVTGPLRIGGYANLPAGFEVNGLMDELSIYHRALTAAEVAAIYAAGSSGKCAPPAPLALAPATANIAPGGTVNFTATGGTPPYQHSVQPNPSGGTILANGTYTAGNTPATDTVRVTDSAINPATATATVTVSCIPPPSGLVSRYKLEDSTSDFTGANPPSGASGLTFGPAKVGQGAVFGTGAFIDIPDSATLANPHLTIMAWVRRDGPGPDPDVAGSVIIGKPTGPFTTSVTLGWNGVTGRFRVAMGDATIMLLSARAFASGQFHHVAVTYDQQQLTLYVDGVVEAQRSQTDAVAYNPSFPWTIGANPPDARAIGVLRTFDGMIDEVTIHNRALSAAEIATQVECVNGPPLQISPTTATVGNGGTVTFTTTGGTPPLTFFSLAADQSGAALVTTDGAGSYTAGPHCGTDVVQISDGNGATVQATITVLDTIAPVINCPANITAEATSPSGSVVTFVTTATDNCTPNPTVTCTPASGSGFSIGTTLVTCWASDGASNSSSCSFTVTVGGPTGTNPFSPPSAGFIVNFAGGGATYGDGGLATNASLLSPLGLACDANGNVFIADADHGVIRQVDTVLVNITTVAGTGEFGFSGDGGSATNAAMRTPIGIALDQNDSLYVADFFNNRIRKISLETGVITTVAGNGNEGYSGDGGPAIAASLNLPQGVAVDRDGNLYVADTDNFRIRKIDATNGIISTIAGNGLRGSTGDGGPATSAKLFTPVRLAVDTDGNVLVLDRSGSSRIRRIDAVTGIITTIAGGGVGTGESGFATNANLGSCADLAVDGDRLYVAGYNRVWKVNLTTGAIRVFAGTGAISGSGDGGAATEATFAQIGGVVAAGGGEVLISDSLANRVRQVGVNATIDLATPDSLLDSLTVVEGRLSLRNSATRTQLVLSNLVLVDHDLEIVSNTALTQLDFPRLATVGGTINVSANSLLTRLNLSAVTNISNDLIVGQNPSVIRFEMPALSKVGRTLIFVGNNSATDIDVGSLTTVGGPITIVDNSLLAEFLAASLTTVGGDIKISGNPKMGHVHLGAMTTVGEAMVITDNSSATDIDVGSLTTVGGLITIVDNSLLAEFLAASLTTVGGDIKISGNPKMGHVHLGAMTTVGEAMVITDNSSATDIDVGSLTTVGGLITIVDNSLLAEFWAASLTTVGGDIKISGNPKMGHVHLGAMTTVGEAMVITDNSSATDIDVGSLTTVGGLITIVDNSLLAEFWAASLTTVGGDIKISGNPKMGHVHLGAMTTVGEAMVITDNSSATDIDVGSLTTVGGLITIVDNSLLAEFWAASLTTVGGDIKISGNPKMGHVHLGAMTTVGEAMVITDNSSATDIDVGSLTTVGGLITIVDNSLLAEFWAASLTTVGGDIKISGNPKMGHVHLGSMTTVGEAVEITDNSSATDIDVGSLTTVGASIRISGNATARRISAPALFSVAEITITNNPVATNINIGSPTVGGSMTLEAQGQADFNLVGPTVHGNLIVRVRGATTFAASTPGGAATISLLNLESTIETFLPTNTFATRVPFSVDHLDPLLLWPVPALGANNVGMILDPVAAYRFNFANVPLSQDATLRFDLNVSGLDAASRSAFLEAIGSNSVTLAVKSDDDGAVFQAFPLCAEGENPIQGGCAQLLKLTASGTILPPGSAANLAVARLEAKVGHFSTYAVVLPPQAMTSAITSPTNGLIRIHGLGVPGNVYALHATTNLSPPIIWTPLATNTAGLNGVFQFSDLNTAEHPQRFYQVVKQ